MEATKQTPTSPPPESGEDVLEAWLSPSTPAPFTFRGVEVSVHGLAWNELIRWQSTLVRAGDDPDDDTYSPRRAAKLIALCVRNKAGKLIFNSADHIERLAKAPGELTQPLFDLCQWKNGLGVYGIAAKKNCDPALLSPLPSGSVETPASSPPAESSSAPASPPS